MAWIQGGVGGLNLLELMGVFAGVLSVVAFAPYVGDILTRKTKPQRSSWLVWSVLSGVSLWVQVAEGATWSLWFAGVQVSGTLVIFMLSIGRGAGSYLRGLDLATIAVATAGLLLWYQTENPAYALGISIGISLFGGLPTVRKAVRHPETETLSTWLLSLTASTLALLSVGTIDFMLLAYPLYLMTLYASFVIAIMVGRRSKQSRSTEAMDWSLPDEVYSSSSSGRDEWWAVGLGYSQPE